MLYRCREFDESCRKRRTTGRKVEQHVSALLHEPFVVPPSSKDQLLLGRLRPLCISKSVDEITALHGVAMRNNLPRLYHCTEEILREPNSPPRPKKSLNTEPGGSHAIIQRIPIHHTLYSLSPSPPPKQRATPMSNANASATMI